MPQYTNGYNLCQYSCNERRRYVNKTVDFPIADNVLAHTINKTLLKSFASPTHNGINSSFTERRLPAVSFTGLASLVSFVANWLGIIHRTTEWAYHTNLDSNLCTSSSVLKCVTWASCVTCGLLFSIGMNLSSSERCSTSPHNLMEKYKNDPSCLNLACEGVVVEEDRMVYDCANPVFRGCISLYMDKLDGIDSENGEGDDFFEDDGCC